MRVLSQSEIAHVSGSGSNVTPLIEDPKSELGRTINDIHEGYISFLNAYVFPYIYYCL